MGRYYALVLFFIGAMAGLVLTGNLFLMFLFWEITALCFLRADLLLQRRSQGGGRRHESPDHHPVGRGRAAGRRAAELMPTWAALRCRSCWNRPKCCPESVLGILAFGFLIAAAAKSAQFPFQTWLPDAMEAPTPISALIHAATMVNAGVYLLARFYPAFEGVPGWREAVMVVGMLSALLAAIMALVANDLKRVLAYSTVSQLGYMVYAVGAGGIFASQFHLLQPLHLQGAALPERGRGDPRGRHARYAPDGRPGQADARSCAPSLSSARWPWPACRS